MRFSQQEKMEVIRLVENSELGVKRTLLNLGINKSTFYNWYSRYHDQGYDGLAPRKPGNKYYWNKIPDTEREKVVDLHIMSLLFYLLTCYILVQMGKNLLNLLVI